MTKTKWVRTQARDLALSALHKERKGVRLHAPMPVSVARLLEDVILKRSINEIAKEAGVTARTLRRWRTAADHPSPDRLRALRDTLSRLR